MLRPGRLKACFSKSSQAEGCGDRFETRPYLAWSEALLRIIFAVRPFPCTKFHEKQNLRDPIASSRRLEPHSHRGEELQGLCLYLSHSLSKGKGIHFSRLEGSKSRNRQTGLFPSHPTSEGGFRILLKRNSFWRGCTDRSQQFSQWIDLSTSPPAVWVDYKSKGAVRVGPRLYRSFCGSLDPR
jgi:hypothetical protein